LALARDSSLAAGDAELVANCEMWLCRAHRLLGDRDRAAASCAAAEAYLAQDPDIVLESALRWQQAELDFETGRFEAALARYRQGHDVAKDEPSSFLFDGTMRADIASSLIALGRPDEAVPWLDEIDRDIAAGKLPQSYAPQIAEQRGLAAIA